MAQSVWDSLSRVINPTRNQPRIVEVLRFENGSLDNEVNKVREGIDSTAAMTIHAGPEIIRSFWNLTDEVISRIGGKFLAVRWKRARKYTEFETHFQQIFEIAESFFQPTNQKAICSLVGHSVMWNEVSPQRNMVAAETQYLSRAFRSDCVEEGARRQFRFSQNQSPVVFDPGSMSWSREYFRSDDNHRLFTWYRYKRIFKLPGSVSTHQSDITMFYKGDYGVTANGKPSPLAGPYHTGSVYKHQASLGNAVEDAIFVDVIHLELTRFVFCDLCEDMKLPSLFRDSIFLALDPEDFGVLCILASEQPAFAAGSLPFSSSTYGRCLKKL